MQHGAGHGGPLRRRAARAGVHTGQATLRAGHLAGPALTVAQQAAGRAAPGEVLATATLRDLAAGTGLAFAPRGELRLEHPPATLELLAAS